MTYSGLHEAVERMPDSSERDQFRILRCAEADSSVGKIHTDEQLVRRLIRKEPDAWQVFLKQYQRLIAQRISVTCEELGRSPKSDLIEDCCSEVLSKLFENDLAALRSFQGKSRLSTWLSVVTRRIALRYLMKHFKADEQARQGDSRFDIQAIPESASAADQSEQTTQSALLNECLQELDESDRRTLMLHTQEKMSYEEIGHVLGISSNSVGPKLARARKRLKKLVEQKQHAAQKSSFPKDVDEMK